MVLTFHTEPIKDFPTIFKAFFQYLLFQCDCITFVSKALKEKIGEIYGLRFGKTNITYAGVVTREVPEDSVKKFLSKFNIKDGSKILLSQGFTSHPMKVEGAKILISVVRKLKDKYPNIILILTKEGIYSNELKKFSENQGISNNIVLTGTLSNPFVPLSICDIYTHITYGKGGVSLALLEAMAMGKPIIATSNYRETMKDGGKNGILVGPDVDKISEKIEYLLENKQIAEELGRNAKQTIEDEFTWEISAKKFIEIYSNNSRVKDL